MEINDYLYEIHKNDADQVEFLNSNEQRISIVAPAGCGKTTTLISKITKMFFDSTIKHYQNVLCLSFSVNAALNMKKSISNNFKRIREYFPEVDEYAKRIDVGNYHNFSIKLISKYGYIIDPNLKDIQSFKIMDDNDVKKIEWIDNEYFTIIENFSADVKSSREFKLTPNMESYLSFLKVILIPNKIMTYNGMLVLAIDLLKKESIRKFYQHYYGVIAVDEFQDTNILQFILLRQLIDECKLYLLGDECQKIYGFIGAVEGLFKTSTSEYKMTQMKFVKNHRCKNQTIVMYSNYIRNALENGVFSKEQITIPMNLYENEDEEAACVLQDVLKNNEGQSNAILVRNNYSGDKYLQLCKQNNVDFFDARFKDGDDSYKYFHTLIKDYIISAEVTSLNYSFLKRMHKYVEEKYNGEYRESYIKLLSTFVDELVLETSPTKRYFTCMSVLNFNGLKHYMENVKTKVIIASIHSAKGLEWDNVYLPTLNAKTFPPYRICKECGLKICKKYDPRVYPGLDDELSVLYVAVTRASTKLNLSYVKKNSNGYINDISCLLNQNNIKLTNW